MDILLGAQTLLEEPGYHCLQGFLDPGTYSTSLDSPVVKERKHSVIHHSGMLSRKHDFYNK